LLVWNLADDILIVLLIGIELLPDGFPAKLQVCPAFSGEFFGSTAKTLRSLRHTGDLQQRLRREALRKSAGELAISPRGEAHCKIASGHRLCQDDGMMVS
jgi:hypothetical protein